MIARRHFLGGLAALVAAGALPSRAERAAAPPVTVYIGAGCGCCGEWVKHVEEQGFRVERRDVDDVAPIKRKLGIREDLWSCHTAVIEGYAIEGHVPAADIKRLLRERPPIAGLAVPGMPAGSPGMEQGGRREPYSTLAFDAGGSRVFERH